ncbi:hypothetical protein E4T42_09639 [Aureobasidium subglaciale]|nr:hypothetical protein E4T38_09807 [Aureobasidium subglaciale]KAI5213372.1 hypothetical protein E4T40_09779 [Aureobasidium subglaciale]KAI5214896.1 hypothetical protein E4T41_09791 [Aureobasidium subglaciale]KAI5235776.1 hypothetical protein E4T42_09639 [Aureobasidium subglaciale]KAI5252965.1 hypothetical protein E4T46_09784 [Aureobasidium subglaciale]
MCTYLFSFKYGFLMKRCNLRRNLYSTKRFKYGSCIIYKAINAFELPLLNTVLLLASGVTITYSHHSLIQGNRNGALLGAIFTVFLAMIFTAFQGVEYAVSSFTISDGAYGSCFYFGTGFHGIHVIIGTIFLAVGL